MSEFAQDEVEVAEMSPETSQFEAAEELLPEEAGAEDSVPENMFRGLGLNEALVRVLDRSGYHTPTPIQAQTIPLILEGRDVLGQAQTGTGKTAAFALPVLQRINLAERRPQVLVLTPTRELAIQVAEAFEKYAGEMRGLRVVPIYGGQDYQVQLRALDRGVQVIVGTPGRVMDHMRRGSLKVDGLKTLVLDEADEMLRMGFAEDVEWVLTQLPAERQIALFSATLPEPIRRIAQCHLRNPAQVTIRQQTATADTIRQRFIVASPHLKEAALARILEAEPIDGVIIFVKMRSTTEPLAEFLSQHGHRAAALNGDVAQKQRERIVESLRSGKIDIVVATDVAARGLDVQRISHVINYDLPFDSEAYVHRIGRTGRAGRSGEAILFVHPRDRHMLRNLERATRQAIEPMELPSNRTINKQRVARFHDKITAALTHPDIEALASIVDQYRREKEIPLEQIAAALALLANGEKPLLMKDAFKPSESFDTHGSSRDSHGGPRHSHDRNSRDRHGDRGPDSRPSRHAGPRGFDEEMETFRVEVGHVNQVKPGNLVGAIANETGINGSSIGRISIFEDYSTVDLPVGMPSDMFQELKKVRVAGQELNISRLAEERRPAAPSAPRAEEKPMKPKKPKRKVAAKPA
ncbi:ATP-dependent RNA helicase DeaD [Anatilimnocola aggregata]|uniref:ATP-dependent RNA helicase DeaD n=1 Tax=Anatilimnocola aggregata TaxID=2528021 RepID=A0A517YN73_9BACT|nr:DEAD/DEAH box helicase [Anatilimnocola aggregata]QDU31664.1 ATP-dependent RNA helicase DeaD [Anatilimnocola aggregata]